MGLLWIGIVNGHAFIALSVYQTICVKSQFKSSTKKQKGSLWNISTLAISV